METTGVSGGDPRAASLYARLAGLAPDPFDPRCPTRVVLDLIGDKWTVLVIASLDEGPRSFGEIRDRVAGITPKVLTSTLRSLERNGLASRRAFAQVPRRVEYALTPLGRTLLAPLGAVREWAEAHVKDMLVAQALADDPRGEAAPANARDGGVARAPAGAARPPGSGRVRRAG